MSNSHIVIIGAGPAGGTAAQTLRKLGYGGRVTLLGAEAHRPYGRPPLSKHYLRGEVDRDSVFLEYAAWYDEHDVSLRLDCIATRLDPAAHLVHLASGETVPYDALLLATGSSPRRLDVDGIDLTGVHTLRTLDDSEALHGRLAGGGRRVVVVGSGWIGMEVAASARLMGNEVTVLERGTSPLAAALGTELGTFMAGIHAGHDVKICSSVQITALEGDSGEVSGVRLAGGELIPADLVLIGIGATPNVGLADAAGITVDDGVLVDERLRSSAPDVYAAGDVANAFHPLGKVRIRSEHLSNAFKGGAAAARIMLGEKIAYDDLPTFVSEQFDVTLQFAGYAPLIHDARLIYRGNPATGSFTVFWVAGDRPVAGAHLNVKDPDKRMQGIIRSGRTIDPAQLGDPNVTLEDIE